MGGNIVTILMTGPLEYWLFTVTVVALKKVSFRKTQNPKTVCEHIASPWQALSA